MLKLKIIACEVFFREIAFCSSNSKNIIDVEFVKQGLHNEPDKLRSEMQERIAAVPPDKYDAILIAYGLCSNGLENVRATHTKIVLPRAHDCLTLFLGSKERYADEFQKNTGTYWYTPGWIERTIMPGKLRMEETMKKFDEYKERYGEDNAEYLIEQDMKWYKNYNCAAFINMQIGNTEYYREKTKSDAEYLKWEFKEIKGDMNLFNKFINGEWNDEDFLIVDIGKTIKPSYNDMIVKTE